jgi:hypothetical protein
MEGVERIVWVRALSALAERAWWVVESAIPEDKFPVASDSATTESRDTLSSTLLADLLDFARKQPVATLWVLTSLVHSLWVRLPAVLKGMGLVLCQILTVVCRFRERTHMIWSDHRTRMEEIQKSCAP